MAEAKKKREWILTKKRADKIVYSSEDDKKTGHSSVGRKKLADEEATLGPVFDKFEREQISNSRRVGPIVIKLPWTKDPPKVVETDNSRALESIRRAVVTRKTG